MSIFQKISDPNRIESCPICLKPRSMRKEDIGSAVWYLPTWEGHDECYSAIRLRDQLIVEEQIKEREKQAQEKRARELQEAISHGFENSGISPDRRTFADLKRYSSNAKAYDAAVDWKFPDPGFFLFGPPGTGKSHILAAIAQTVPDKFTSGFSMIRWGRWVKETYATNDFGARENMSRRIRETDVLFVDDIGSEKLSEHSESLLDDIIHEREEFRRPTFMSSNLTPEGLEKILTPRLWSRMQSLMRFIEVGGKDIRKAKGVKK